MLSEAPILEIRQLGRACKVTAIDPQSLIEVSFQAPASIPARALHRLALQKLARAIGMAQGF